MATEPIKQVIEQTIGIHFLICQTFISLVSTIFENSSVTPLLA